MYFVSCVFADWDKLTRSPKQPRLGMSFKSILTQPKLFVFLKENSVNCAPCLFVFTDNVYSNNIGTRGDILLAAHGSSNCAFTFFQQTCQEFFWSTSKLSQFLVSCLFVKRFPFLCTDLSWMLEMLLELWVELYPWQLQGHTQTRPEKVPKCSFPQMYSKYASESRTSMWIDEHPWHLS